MADLTTLRTHRDALITALLYAIDSCIAQEEACLEETDYFKGFTPGTFKAEMTFTHVRADGTEGIREIKCNPELDLTKDIWSQITTPVGDIVPKAKKKAKTPKKKAPTKKAGKLPGKRLA
jgi:hypothetical protein